MLGLPAKERTAQSPVAVITRIEDGLPVTALDRVARLLAPGDAQFKYRLVPRRPTNAGRPPIGSRRTRARVWPGVARVWAVALDVWKTEEAARAFLFRAHPMIEDRRPIDVVIQSEFGAELVVEILGRLKYGTATSPHKF